MRQEDKKKIKKEVEKKDFASPRSKEVKLPPRESLNRNAKVKPTKIKVQHKNTTDTSNTTNKVD